LNLLRIFFRLLITVLPWALKRRVLVRLYGYDIHPLSYIGLSWVYPGRLILGADARISHFSFFRDIEEVRLLCGSQVGSLVFVTGFPKDIGKHYCNEKDRVTLLKIGRESHITSRHLIDCTNKVEIGDFTTIAGYRTQILTHAIDLNVPMQKSAPVKIGNFCFISTATVILPGVEIPDFCVVAAGSVVTKSVPNSYGIYAGVPARLVKSLEKDCGYFIRKAGRVD